MKDFKVFLLAVSILALFCFTSLGQGLPRIQEGVTRAWIGPVYGELRDDGTQKQHPGFPKTIGIE